MTTILGLNLNHPDAAAALIVDGQLVAAVAEERLGRRLKHDTAFPKNAINAVLKIGGARLSEVDYVSIPRAETASLGAKIAHVLRHPMTGLPAYAEHRRRAQRGSEFNSELAAACDCDPSLIRAKLVHVEHHLAHIASAYYCSPFDGLTAGLSYDASGDFTSLMAARCEGTRIEILDRVHLPHSLGFFYTASCQFIGFDQFGEEYKVMGLAPYGEDAYAAEMRRLVDWSEDAWFRLGSGFFGMHSGGESGRLDANGQVVMSPLYTDAWRKLFGEPRRRGTEVLQRDMNIARSCQARFEDAAMHCFGRLQKLVPTKQLAYAGGCALNGVANARVLRDTPFEQVYLQAAASDDGLSVGAALWTWHNVAGGRERFHMRHAYWGPEYSESELTQCAARSHMPNRVVQGGQLARTTARLLRAGLVVGWYQGRSEWGPRALGNRSILADPTRPGMKDLINQKIKRREMFRPFAPTVVRHAVSTYFEQDVFSPFMMHVVKIRPQWQSKLPAITHVDGTGRLQSIDRETNPLYFDVIEEFGRLSGIPIVLNTSFNENEPIVDTPDQALKCFLRSGLDALILGRNVIVKPEHEHLLAQTTDERARVATPA